MQLKTENAGGVTLERRLVELAWTDPGFAGMLETDPRQALKALGVLRDPATRGAAGRCGHGNQSDGLVAER
jgi:hypothetical protein